MIERRLFFLLKKRLSEVPAVVLLGPRQVGKTTLANQAGEDLGALYLDLESVRNTAKLSEPESYLEDHLDRLLIFDEIHRMPGLFPVIREMIDRARARGKRQGLYLFLGSASLDLLRQSGESLAGRVTYMELSPLSALEVSGSGTQSSSTIDSLWLRGGFPESFLSGSDEQSFRWREDLIRTYLERDIPQFGFRVSPLALRRLWTMLAHGQGGITNASHLARSLGVSSKTASSYIDILSELFLVRRLPPWYANVGKRLVRSPKVYIRDSGIAHCLLSIFDKEALLSHPAVGGSWEGFVIENLLSLAPPGSEGYFYRTSGGAEIDLFLVFPGGRSWAIEIKRSMSPRPERGFFSACNDLSPSERFLVYPGEESYRVAEGTLALSLRSLSERLVAKTPSF